MFLGLVFPVQVWAQGLQNQGNIVIDTVRFEQEIQDLTIEYKSGLEVYEEKKNKLDFAKAQYEQLQTLASLEEAVDVGREFFVARDEVLLSYAKLLRLKLYTSFGIFLKTKQDKIAAMDDLISRLEKHNQNSKKIESKDDIINQTSEFSLVGLRLQAESARIVPLFSLGKLQSTFDKTALLIDKVDAHIEESNFSAAKKAEKERGMQQIRREEEDIKLILKELNGPIILDKRGGVVKSKYDSNTVYSGISKLLSYLGEIAAD